MTQSKFLGQLFGIGAVIFCCTIATDFLVDVSMLFAYISTSFFIILSLVIYKLIHLSLQSENPNRFSQAFMLVTFFKMMLSILLIIIYFVIARPSNIYFVIPFLINYLIFTVFEVSFMIKMAKQF